MTKHNTPALRFDGFDGEWEVKEFGSVVTRSSTSSAEPALPRLEYEDIVSGVGVLNKDLNRKESLKAGLLFGPGDVLYGKLRPYLKNMLLPDFRGIAVGDFWVLQSLTADPKFLYQLIQTPMYAAVTSISSGSKMPRADWKLVSRSHMLFPSTSEEQRAIGELFSDLDALIEQHRAKHANLQQIKTALLQRMFPQDGADAPELRLGGFEGVWTYTRLADIAQMYQPQTIASKELQKSGVPVFGANGFIGFYNAANHTTDQVTISARGENTGTPSYVSGPVWITGNSMVVNVDSSSIDKRFLYGTLSSRSLKSLVTGGAQPQLTRNVLNEYRISIPPTLEEQRAIGEVFSNLDSLIAAEASYITQLIQAKTALLQRMFV